VHCQGYAGEAAVLGKGEKGMTVKGFEKRKKARRRTKCTKALSGWSKHKDSRKGRAWKEWERAEITLVEKECPRKGRGGCGVSGGRRLPLDGEAR